MMTDGGSADIPRTIWTLWHQGLDQAPTLVRRCVDSWRVHNPGWTLDVHDGNSIKRFVDLDGALGDNRARVTHPALSDVVRIELLHEYGGVWVDATCFCCRPLDHWLPAAASRGFLAFRDPGPDRPVSTWFLASAAGSPIVTAWRRRVRDYWSSASFVNQNRLLVKPLALPLEALLQRSPHRSTRFERLFRSLTRLRVYPYYWFHYLFARMIQEEPETAAAWDEVPAFNADVPHRVQHHGIFRPPSANLREEIDRREAPFYKLTWKIDEARVPLDCAQEYLLASLPDGPEAAEERPEP